MSALVLSNVFWIYNTIDFGITHTYAMQSCEESSKALEQLISLLPIAIQSQHTREAILSASRVRGDEVVFEKHGLTWVGGLGLRFSDEGKLVEVIREP
ncbi:MAG: hypothetical protein WD397_06315 [Wenzhouxiangellaceae bacterium]